MLEMGFGMVLTRSMRSHFGMALDTAESIVFQSNGFRDGYLRPSHLAVFVFSNFCDYREWQFPYPCAVPPTVMLSTFNVGIPTPTGTLCPSLPHVPTPSSSCRSWPTMETRVSTSGPFPIR